MERRQGGKDQPCYASSLAGVSHPTVGMREGSSSAAARLYLPVSLGMADNSAETTQKLPGKRYLNSLSLSKKEKTCLRKEGFQIAPTFVGVIAACSGGYEGALQSPEKYQPGLPFVETSIVVF